MATTNKVVVLNTAGTYHEVLATGDTLAANVIQLSTDAGNALALGTDGGLMVTVPAQYPDDQVLTSDNTGSVSLTMTPSAPNAEGQVNYTVKADVKVDPAVNNNLSVTASGLLVPKANNLTAVAAPTTVNDTTTPTTFFGGNASALGTPVGFAEFTIDGVVRLIPYYAVP